MAARPRASPPAIQNRAAARNIQLTVNFLLLVSCRVHGVVRQQLRLKSFPVPEAFNLPRGPLLGEVAIHDSCTHDENVVMGEVGVGGVGRGGAGGEPRADEWVGGEGRIV